MRKRTWVVVSLLFGLTTLVPWLLLLCMNHGLFGVPPELADDSIYYYARVESVVAGHPFIGNPYFKEHTDEIASAFFGADWIASIPRLLHIPLFPSILLNLIVWSSVYVFLCLWLLSLSGLSRKHTLLGAVTLFISAFWLLERPVAMQIVFPVYILFLASFLWWLQEPQSGRRSLALVGSTVLSFYTYTYLWQIVTVCLLVSHALLLHDFKKWKRILAIDAVTER